MGDRWLKVGSGRWVVRAPACNGISLGSNPDISQKYVQNGRHKQRNGQHTLARQIKNKNIYKRSSLPGDGLKS